MGDAVASTMEWVVEFPDGHVARFEGRRLDIGDWLFRQAKTDKAHFSPPLVRNLFVAMFFDPWWSA